MNNIDALRTQILANPEEFGLSRGVTEAEVGIVSALTSYDGNPGGRIHYYVFVGAQDVPALVAQSLPAWTRPKQAVNPYCPAIPQMQMATDILPWTTGEIQIGFQQIFWASYVHGSSLADLVDERQGIELLVSVLKRLQQPPWHPLQPHRESLVEYTDMLKQICQHLPELGKVQERLCELMADDWATLRWGFSHGDLWCKNIIVSNAQQFCVIDWEWAALLRPATCDHLDLTLSAVKTVHGLNHEEAFTCLVKGDSQIETHLRNLLKSYWTEIGYGNRQIRLTLLTYLVWAQYRLMMQNRDHPRTDNRNIGLALMACVESDTYLKKMYL